MTRRSALTSSQRIDLVQRRRTREGTQYSEQPVPLTIQRLSGAGDGNGTGGTATPVLNMSWLSPDLSWTDVNASWLA